MVLCLISDSTCGYHNKHIGQDSNRGSKRRDTCGIGNVFKELLEVLGKDGEIVGRVRSSGEKSLISPPETMAWVDKLELTGKSRSFPHPAAGLDMKGGGLRGLV